ncbi:GrpB family protein [Arthrobacter sp. G119Y2]|uniref:GrpB family protein n=1 Tax=Arthrobacter sp. G119Y2 TaxID=3134965 RepID=UPI0040491463
MHRRTDPARHSYDDRWPDVYQTHRRRIEAALAPLRVEIEHIGSTSVPGLAAKPIIDIVVVVEDITAEEDYLDPLVTARIRAAGTRTGTPARAHTAREVHVHLYQCGAPREPCSAGSGTT